MRRDILYKFFEGKASPKEQRLIGQWLDESEKHKEVLVRERMVFDAMIVLVPADRCSSIYRLFGIRYLIFSS